MQIEMRDIATIQPYENNPRRNDDSIDAVSASIKEYGFRQPIVIDETGVVIVGHSRLRAAVKLGMQKVPVHIAIGLTPQQAKAYRLADNQTATLSTWDDDKLTAELMELQKQGFDLDLTGFGSEQLNELMNIPTDGLTDPDEVPAPPDEATTKPGDLIILGNHRLYCGDSSKPKDVDLLLGGATIQLVNTDPPYNVKVEPRSNNAIAAGNSSFAVPKKRTHHQSFDVARSGEKQATHKKLRAKDRPLANDFVTDQAFDEMLDAWFGNMARVLDRGRSLYMQSVYMGRLRQCRQLPSTPQETWPLLQSGHYLGQAASGTDQERLHGSA